MGYRIGKRFRFDASHQLPLPPGHKCSRLHGHTFTVEVILAASELRPPGFVADFADLAALQGYIDTVLDHRHLNDVLDEPPTSETLARHLFTWCTAHLPPPLPELVYEVRVSETPATWAAYRSGCASWRD